MTKSGKKVKQKDIAKLANVGVSTVSMILNGQGHRFSKEVVQRVMEADKAFSYSTGKIAKLAESTRKPKEILYCLKQHTFVNQLPPFYSTLSYAMERAISKNEYDLLIKNITDINELDNLIAARRDSLAGMILHGNFKNIDMSFIPESLPYVFILPHFEPANAVSVELDNQTGSYELTKWLLDHGHQHLVFLGMDQNSTQFKSRLNGFLLALKYHDLQEAIPYDKISGNIQSDTEFRQLATQFIKDLNNTRPKPTAVVCSCSNFASILIQEAMNAGISIPNDLSVAGFNNIPSAESSPSQLFSLDIPIAKVAETAVAMLHFQSEQTITSPFKVVLPCNQIVFGTSASIRQ